MELASSRRHVEDRGFFSYVSLSDELYLMR